MTKLNINHLVISWSTSKGRDTYGYNICRLDDRQTGKRYRTCGGGYDMVGTVFGHWLEDYYQADLGEYFKANKAALVGSYGGYWKHPDLYGCHIDMDNGRVILDGACGINSMTQIAEAIGLQVQWEGNKKGHTTGYYVAREVAELEAA